MSTPQSLVSRPQLNIQKLKKSIDKALLTLLDQKNLTKISLNHKH